MFAEEKFIQLSRKFVCVRLESFESEANQKLVRSFTGGSFANTSCCVLAPDGKTKITETGRSPQMVFGRTPSSNTSSGERPERPSGERPERPGGERPARPSGQDSGGRYETIYTNMEAIAKKYPGQSAEEDSVLQDFDSFKQSLNVASGDQRLLVYAVASDSESNQWQATLRSVANDPDVVGRYHFDTAGKADASWSDVITGDTMKSGIFIIQSSEFGQDGMILAELDLTSDKAAILKALSDANQKFAASEKRKVFAEHVDKGIEIGVSYEDNMPYGEDRDGDGIINKRPERK